VFPSQLANTATSPNSHLSRKLHALLHHSELPEMTGRQYAMAALLRFADRKAPLDQIFGEMTEWPAIRPWAEMNGWTMFTIWQGH
jgi:hypothetical protein